MPDLVLYSLGLLACATVSALCVLTVVGWRRPAGSFPWAHAAVLAGIYAGVLAGGTVMQLPIKWPATTALSRFLVIVLPATILLEWWIAADRVRAAWIWLFRGVLAIAAIRVILHGSVYLRADGKGEWSLATAVAFILMGGLGMTIVWWLLCQLDRRVNGVSMTLLLCVSILAAGMVVMLAGYLAGGQAAMLLATAVACVTLLPRALRFPIPTAARVSVSLVTLGSLLLIGRLFGGLSNLQVGLLGMAPLMGWMVELPRLKRLPPWQQVVLRVIAVLLPLAVVLWGARRDFNRKFSPLLVHHRQLLEPRYDLCRQSQGQQKPENVGECGQNGC